MSLFSSIKDHTTSLRHENYNITANQFTIITCDKNGLKLVIKIRPSLNDMVAAKVRFFDLL